MTIMWKKIAAVCALLVLIAVLAGAADKASDIAIVVNTASKLEDLSSADLAKILKAEKTKSAEGIKYVIAVRESGAPERDAVLKVVYKMIDADYEKFFLQATFAGTIQSAPKQLSSPNSVRQFVSSNPGAISYLRASDVDASVKVLKIDGKSPGDAEYPIPLK